MSDPRAAAVSDASGRRARGAGPRASPPRHGSRARPTALIAYLALGTVLGIALTKSEVISWFRIQEMFRFQSFHVYGVLGSAVATAGVSLVAIRRLGLRTLSGAAITLPAKADGRRPTRYWAGGVTFGLGWALLGACPGPIYALIGNGVTVMLVALASALAGTWAYASLASRLPHG